MSRRCATKSSAGACAACRCSRRAATPATSRPAPRQMLHKARLPEPHDDRSRPLRLVHCDLLSRRAAGGRAVDRLDRARLSRPESAAARARTERHQPALGPLRDGDPMSHISESTEAAPRRRALLMLLPLVVFMGLAVLFWYGLG